MAIKISEEDYNKEKAIELSDGTILDIPNRTAELYEKIVEIEKTRTKISEYDYYKSILETIYGKTGFKKIAPNLKQTNLDYLSKIVIITLENFLEDKIKSQEEQIAKQAKILEPLSNKINTITPFIKNLK